MKKLMIVCAAALCLGALGDVETTWDDAQHVSWYYTVTNGEATVYVQNVAPDHGDFVIPSTLGGYPVREMKWGIFKNFSAVTSVRVPGSIRKIPGEAFYVSRDTSLTNVVIEPGCLDIREDSFIRCYKLEHVGIPNTVTNIGYEAFTLCKALKSVSIPDSVATIADRAFNQCEALEELSLGSGVKSIGETAFMNCNVLRSVVLPDGLEAIGTCAFAGCWAMQIDRIPASVRWIGSGAFSNCPESIFDLESVPEVRILDGWAVGSTYDVAGEVDLSGVRGVADGVFRDQANVTHVTLPAGLETIGLGLFNGCRGLVSVTMPASLRKIDGYAFNGCTSLETFVVPSGVTNIEGLAFMNCTSLTSITLPSELESLGHSAFESCESLKAIEIPGGVRELPSEVFSRCSALATVKLPDGLERIRGAAFDFCPCIDEETLPGCGLVDGWLVEADIYTAEARVPSTLRGLADGVFEFHTYLTNAVVEGTFTEVPDSFFNGCSALRQVTLPKSITRIGEFAFGSCTALEAVPIPEGVTSIGEKAFVACAFTEVWVPSNVTEIAALAFASCRNLKKAYLPIALKGVVDERSVFNGCFDVEVRYYLPDGSLEPVHPGECEVTVRVAEGQEALGSVTEGGLWKFGSKITLKATPEAGTIFAGWYRNDEKNAASTSLSYAIDVPEEDSVTYTAKFVSAEEDAESLKINGLEETYEVNGPFGLVLAIESFSPATAKVTGLPKGLAYDADSRTISGTPATPGTYPVKVLLKNKTVAKGVEKTFTIVVKNLESELIQGLDPAPGAYVFVAGTEIAPIVPKLAGEGWTLKVANPVAGLKADKTTGAISGVSSAKPGSYTVTFTASKKGEPNAVATITVTIENRVLSVVSVGAGNGTVTGPGDYPAGKKVTLKAVAATKDDEGKGHVKSVFAGWYRDAGCTMKADFGGVDYRTPSVSYVTTDQYATFYARFEPAEADVAAVDFALKGQMPNGTAITPAPIDVSGCTSLPTVKVTGLPAGLKFTAKALDVKATTKAPAAHYEANTIYGTPTKSGVYTVVATVTTAGKKTASASQTIVVRKPGEYVVKAEVPTVDGGVPGKVTGMGVYSEGKKVTLKATANKGYVFSGWYDGDALVTQAASCVIDAMPASDVNLTAVFVTVDADRASVAAAFGGSLLVPWVSKDETHARATNVTAGVSLEWPVAASALSATTVAVSGLPAGLKFTAKDILKKGSKTEVEIPANTIYGAPTSASKVDRYTAEVMPSTVKVTVTTTGKNKQTYQIDVTVDPLPAWAVGTFAGPSYGDDGTNGLASVTIAASGKISAKQPVAGKAVSFSATCFDRYDAEADAYVVTLTAKVGSEIVTNVMAVTAAESGTGFVEADLFDAWQHSWKVEPWKTVGKSFDKREVSYEEEGVRVTLKFSASGTAKVAGEFAKLDDEGNYVYNKYGVLQTVKATGSATLLPTLGEGGETRYLIFVYLAPKGLPAHARCVEVAAEVTE